MGRRNTAGLSTDICRYRYMDVRVEMETGTKSFADTFTRDIVLFHFKLLDVTIVMRIYKEKVFIAF